MRWGHYGGREGAPGRPGRSTRIRQRYHCLPLRGTGDPHTFTEPLPRLLPVPSQPRTCARCHQTIDPTAAPAAPRKHSYTLAEMARALFLCGSGWSYRSASQRMRRDSHVHRAGSGDEREFGLAADWIELFAPMLGQHLLADRWPADAVVLDSVPMALAGPLNPQGFPRRGGTAAWTVMVAGGYSARTFKIARLHAVPGSPDAQEWAELLLRVPGQPGRVISDIDKAIEGGVRLAWPGVEHVRAFDKLQRRLRDADDSAIKLDHRHSRTDPIWIAAGDALKDLAGWRKFVRLVRRLKSSRPRPQETLAWIARHQRLVHDQLQLPMRFPSDTGPLEQKAAELRGWFTLRKGMIRNQERTDRLLTLMAIHLNGDDNEDTYAQLLTSHTAGRRGWLPRHNLINGAPRLH